MARTSHSSPNYQLSLFEEHKTENLLTEIDKLATALVNKISKLDASLDVDPFSLVSFDRDSEDVLVINARWFIEAKKTFKELENLKALAFDLRHRQEFDDKAKTFNSDLLDDLILECNSLLRYCSMGQELLNSRIFFDNEKRLEHEAQEKEVLEQSSTHLARFYISLLKFITELKNCSYYTLSSL
jgi:hypothetical protein